MALGRAGVDVAERRARARGLRPQASDSMATGPGPIHFPAGRADVAPLPVIIVFHFGRLEIPARFEY